MNEEAVRGDEPRVTEQVSGYELTVVELAAALRGMSRSEYVRVVAVAAAEGDIGSVPDLVSRLRDGGGSALPGFCGCVCTCAGCRVVTGV